MSQEFSRMENRILGALSGLDDFLMNPLIQCHCGTTPETSGNAFGTNQGTNENESQSDLHPGAGLLQSQTTGNSDPEEGYDRNTLVLQAAVCDGQVYDITCGNVHNENHGTNFPYFKTEATTKKS